MANSHAGRLGGRNKNPAEPSDGNRRMSSLGAQSERLRTPADEHVSAFDRLIAPLFWHHLSPQKPFTLRYPAPAVCRIRIRISTFSHVSIPLSFIWSSAAGCFPCCKEVVAWSGPEFRVGSLAWGGCGRGVVIASGRWWRPGWEQMARSGVEWQVERLDGWARARGLWLETG